MITPDDKMIQILPDKNKVSSVDEYLKKFNLRTNGVTSKEGLLDPFLINLYNMEEEDYNRWYSSVKMMNIKFFNVEPSIVNLISTDPNNLDLLIDFNELYKIRKSVVRNICNDYYKKLEILAPGKKDKLIVIKELLEGKDKKFRNEMAILFNNKCFYDLRERLVDEKKDSIRKNSKELTQVYDVVLPKIRKMLENEFVKNHLEIIEYLNNIVDDIPTSLENELDLVKTKLIASKQKTEDRYIRGRSIDIANQSVKKQQKIK